ncbi:MULTISPECIES: histidine kinase [Reinekea]|uniref:sensor histidine kinase n=1 Tax=Reinekea TaxID=230494 RepID=UPI002355A91F|nr:MULTISPECIES: histidine kinase [Reinekea]MDO7643625.1 histidine kinase [Reinekea forsetii]
MTRAEQGAGHQRLVIPDICTSTALFFLVLVSELCVVAWELAGQSFRWAELGYRSLAVQWIVLLSAAALCRLRALLPYWSLRTGWLVCFATVQLIGLAVLLVSQRQVDAAAWNWAGVAQQSLAIGIVSAMVLRFFQLQQRVIDQSQAEISSQMDALQARIKPHFLFNSLNTIAELVVTRPVAAEQAVENLSALFRANLKTTSSFSPLAQELELVRGYLQLEQWRLTDRLSVLWQESVHDPDWPVPVLCLQPLVENAVVHGVAAQAAGGQIHIAVLQTPRVTTLSVTNAIGADGSGHVGHGVGLDNVQRRLGVLYGDRARCRIERTQDQYRVTLTLPKP